MVDLLVSHPGLRGLYVEINRRQSTFAVQSRPNLVLDVHVQELCWCMEMLGPLRAVRVGDELFMDLRIWGYNLGICCYSVLNGKELDEICPKFCVFLDGLRECIGGVKLGMLGGIKSKKNQLTDDALRIRWNPRY